MEFGLAPIQSAPDFEPMLEQSRLAEALGYGVLWAHEHHSQAMMYPDPLLALAAIAGVTRRIGLGTNMLLLPIHHPVRVAQQAAMVDVLSHGRLRLGVANTFENVAARVASHRAARRELGLPDAAPLLNRIVCTVASSSQKAQAEVFFARALLALYDAWGHANVAALGAAARAGGAVDPALRREGDPTLPHGGAVMRGATRCQT